MKIGIYAGTFDPIHTGHIQFAVNAVRNTELEKVIIVAEKNPYRKKPYASWSHRQAMIERATEDIIEADHDYEFSNLLAHQYTMKNMLDAAKKHYGNQHEFWFLVGSDIFEHMKRWQEITEQHEYGGFVVALRDDHTKAWLDERVEELQAHNFPVAITLVESPHPHISSRKIREQIADRQVPSDIDGSTYRYIIEHQIYL